MNYTEARKYLKHLSIYGSVLGLDNVKILLERMGNPQENLKVVHVAGTNGKGSTIAFLQSILMEAGYRVGRYSSPAVFHYREIISVNNVFIEKEYLADILTKIKEKCFEMTQMGCLHPTLFEIETVLALEYFKRKNCDIVLVECGMGGDTDATNVFKDVLCSVITSISLDHTKFLGDTIGKIAKVKAGIIKKNCPVVMARQEREAEQVIKQKAVKTGSKLIIAMPINDYSVEKYRTRIRYKAQNGKIYCARLSMSGTYQLRNAAIAIETALVLEKQGYHIEKYIEFGLEKAFWQGRMEVVTKKPLLVIDGAHNPGAIRELKSSLDLYFTNKKITFIMGVLSDKDFDSEAKIIAQRAELIITVTPDNERALDCHKLAQVLRRYHSNVISAESVDKALQVAEKSVEENQSDMIVAFGSLSYLSEIKNQAKQLWP